MVCDIWFKIAHLMMVSPKFLSVFRTIKLFCLNKYCIAAVCIGSKLEGLGFGIYIFSAAQNFDQKVLAVWLSR